VIEPDRRRDHGLSDIIAAIIGGPSLVSARVGSYRTVGRPFPTGPIVRRRTL